MYCRILELERLK